MKKIEEYVRSIPDFPEPGIIFRDITSVLNDAEGLQLAIDSMDDLLKGVDFDVVVGTESRGFIFGVPIAYKEQKPFVPVRKKGKLPLRDYFSGPMIWSMAALQSRCTRIPSNRARRLLSWMTSSLPAEPWRPVSR